MLELADRAQSVLDNNTKELIPVDRAAGTWFTASDKSLADWQRAISAPATAHLLAELDQDLLAPALTQIVANTHSYLTQREYRSTKQSANLVSLQKFQEASITGIVIKVDGMELVLDETAILPLTTQQLQFGFEISHNAKTPLYLNVKANGQRRYTSPIDNGYKVSKWWYDRSGEAIDLKDGVLAANQGDLFTVVVEIDRTVDGSGADLLLTDLLPTGFEIESATIADPKIDDIEINLNEGRKPYFRAEMDDRLIAHFDGRWFKENFAFIRYTVRAAYEGTAQIPDATVEEMYAPEINGRSNIGRTTVQAPR